MKTVIFSGFVIPGMSMQRIFITFGLLITFIPSLIAQMDSSSLDHTYKLTVEEDMLTLKIKNIGERKIQSADRSLENVFETIVAASIITDEEIKRSGAISVAEALRLLPDVFVREKTNGYFSVHIRGGENINNNLSNYENTNILLTINGVPFNDTYQGGIFWEALPVGLIDIKQIEVVRTPSSSLYGTDALAGIINIVTKVTDTKYLKANGNFQGGNNNTFSHQANASFAALDKGLFKISTYYNARDRFQDSYFITGRNAYVPSDSLLFYQANVEKTNTYTNASMSNFGINGFGTWKVNSKVNFEAMYSNVTSNVQSVLQGLDRLMLTGRSAKSTWVNLRSEIYGLNTTISYQKNLQNLGVGYEGLEVQSGKWYISTDYSYKIKYAQLQIGGVFQHDSYHNEDFMSRDEIRDVAYHHKIIPGKSQMASYGVYVSPMVYAFRGKSKTSVTIRSDYLQNYDKLYLSYRFGSLYKLSKKSLLRGVYSTGYQTTPLMQYQYLENISNELQNASHDILSYEMRSYEIGFRTKPLNELYIDFTLFDHKGLRHHVSEQKSNIAETFLRRGLTLSTALTLNKFKAKSFLTYLHTNTWNQQRSLDDELNPKFTGGVSSSYSMFLNKLVIGANAYFYDGYLFQEYDNIIYLPGKSLIDCKVSYNILGEHTIYATGKNVLNDTSVEFPYADKVGRVFLLGVDLVF